jgi:hypothetical protein
MRTTQLGRQPVADVLCRGDFGGHRVPVVAVRKDCVAVSVAAQMLGDGRQPACRCGSFRPRSRGDRRDHGRIVGVGQLRWVRQCIEHIFDSSGRL